IGLGALKYFILKVDPRKTMLFNPAESIDFNGNTAPFIQYTYARICSLERKAGQAESVDLKVAISSLDDKEIEIVKLLAEFPATVVAAAADHSPAVVAAYAYEMAKLYNQYYHEHPILREGVSASDRALRLSISLVVARVILSAMSLLGIEMPDRM
ncbi:MAG: DALR anticodon-binding domain-containing protein, partial [Mucinivorans sp.]